MAGAPGWYVLPILVIGLAGGIGQGVLNLYASGLDLEALVPRLRRVHTTLITSVAAIALLYPGTFALLLMGGNTSPCGPRSAPRYWCARCRTPGGLSPRR